MTPNQQIGLGIILVILAIALAACVWVLRRQDRGTGKRIQLNEPAPGSFAAAVLAAEGAANEYKYAVLVGNEELLRQTARRVMSTGNALVLAIREREEKARSREKVRTGQNPYASAAGGVSVSESDRLAGEPTPRTGRRKADAKEHRW